MNALQTLDSLRKKYDFTKIYMIQQDQTHIVSLCDTFFSLTGNCYLSWKLMKLYFDNNLTNYLEANSDDKSYYKEHGYPLPKNKLLKMETLTEDTSRHLSHYREAYNISKIYIGFLDIPKLMLKATPDINESQKPTVVDGIRGDGLCSIWAVLVGASFYKKDVMNDASTLQHVEERIMDTLAEEDFQTNSGLTTVQLIQQHQQRQSDGKGLEYNDYVNYIMALSYLLNIKVRYFTISKAKTNVKGSPSAMTVEDLTYPPFRSRLNIPRIDILLISDDKHFHFLSNTELTLKCVKWWRLQWKANPSILLPNRDVPRHPSENKNLTPIFVPLPFQSA